MPSKMFSIPSHFKDIGFNTRILTANDFYECCKFEGIEVKLFEREDPDSFYGAFVPSTISPTDKPLILIGKDLSAEPLLITAFHELGHYYQTSDRPDIQDVHTFGDDGSDKYTFGHLCKKEYQAHAIAACALLPMPFLGTKIKKELEMVRKLSQVERRTWRLKKINKLQKKYIDYKEEWIDFRLRVAMKLNM